MRTISESSIRSIPGEAEKCVQVPETAKFNFLMGSNPWIGDVWESMCSVKNDSDCAKSALDLNDFQIDTKVDFVVDAVVMFSEALEKCHEDRCSVNTDRFFWNYLMKAKVEGRQRQSSIP